jgi:hypothetical protein
MKMLSFIIVILTISKPVFSQTARWNETNLISVCFDKIIQDASDRVFRNFSVITDFYSNAYFCSDFDTRYKNIGDTVQLQCLVELRSYKEVDPNDNAIYKYQVRATFRVSQSYSFSDPQSVILENCNFKAPAAYLLNSSLGKTPMPPGLNQ